MNQLDISSIKNKELDLLKILHDYCDKHHLTYFLIFGSLLGSIRHSGFIPWDDDIDVMMPRKDYEYLINNFSKENIKDTQILNKHTNKYFYLTYSKLVDSSIYLYEKGASILTGIWIDIYPYDYVPNIKLFKYLYVRRVKLQHLKINLYRNALTATPRKKYKKIIAKSLRLFINEKTVFHQYEKLDRLIKRYKDKPSNYAGILYRTYANKIYTFPSKYLKEVELHKFESLNVYIPSSYDTVLSFSYEDYKTLPPKEDQVPHHRYIAFNKVKDKHAIILASGLGSRISSLTKDTPKPLIKINNKPMIEYMIEALSNIGVKDISIVIGYKKEAFYCLKDKYKDINISYIINDKYKEYGNIYSTYLGIKDIKDSNVFIIEGDQYISNKDILINSYSNSLLFGYYSKKKNETMSYITIPLTRRVKDISRYKSHYYVSNGISYISAYDLDKLKESIKQEITNTPKDSNTFWEKALINILEDSCFTIRETNKNDVIEIDTLKDLLSVDSCYK